METFSVCCIARDKAAVLRAFVACYLAAGAERVVLFLDQAIEDDPDGRALAALHAQERVDVTLCDAAFWQARTGTRPDQVVDRMGLVFQETVLATASDWVLCCDVDELIHSPDPLGTLLGAVPAIEPSVRIRNSEAVWGPNADPDALFGADYERDAYHYRLHGLRHLFNLVLYGRVLAFFGPGVVSHAQGKQAVRRGVEAEIWTPHTLQIDGAMRNVWLADLVPAARPTRIIHFDAVNFAGWQHKWRRRETGQDHARSMSGRRRRQLAAFVKAREAGRARALFRRLFGLTRLQVWALTALGLLSPLPEAGFKAPDPTPGAPGA